MNSNRFFITGAGGQLAKAFIQQFQAQNADYKAFKRGELDITDYAALKEAIDTCQPTHILNCAAFNDVDATEIDDTEAQNINCIAVKNLVKIAKLKGIFLVHFSTDYVFDGEKNRPYVEEDRTNPINKYGESKLMGEKAVKELVDQSLIFRLSWVYGESETNYLEMLSKRLKKERKFWIVTNQISVPTFTYDVVDVVLLAIEKKISGLFHLTNSGSCSRYEWTRCFFEKIGADVELEAILSDEFESAAVRPKYTVMSNELIKETLQIEIVRWQDAMNKYLVLFKDQENK